MAAIGGSTDTVFAPGKVLLGKSSGSQPYLPTSSPANPAPGVLNPSGAPGTVNASTNVGGTAQVPKTNILNPEAIRASGSGPFDPAYRQDLATFSGGQFFRPNGGLSFNPTGDLSDLFSTPTGAGGAPVPGLPPSLISMTLGAQPFTYSAPQPPDSSSNSGLPDWQSWLQQWRNAGSSFGLDLKAFSNL